MFGKKKDELKNRIIKEIDEFEKQERKDFSNLSKTLRRIPQLRSKSNFNPEDNYIKMSKKELKIKILELSKLTKEQILQLLLIRRKDFLEKAEKESKFLFSNINKYFDNDNDEIKTPHESDWYQYMILCVKLDTIIDYIEHIKNIKEGLEKNIKIVRFLNTSDSKLIQFDKNKRSLYEKIISIHMIAQVFYYIIYPIYDSIKFIYNSIIGIFDVIIIKMKEARLSEIDLNQLLVKIESDYNRIKSKIFISGLEIENIKLDELFYPIIKDELICKPFLISNIHKSEFGRVHFPEEQEAKKNYIQYEDHFIFSIQESIRPDKIRLKKTDCIYINSTGYLLIGRKKRIDKK